VGPSSTLACVRIRPPGLGLVLAALLVPACPAAAATHTVVASGTVFTPADVTIVQGDTVTWSNGGGEHNVRFDDGSFAFPAAPDLSAWSVSRSFPTVGVFRYHCERHGYPNGVDMSGAVHVNAAPNPPAGQPVSADRTAPALTVSAVARQKVLRRRAMFVRAQVNEASLVVARAWVSVPKTRRSFRARTVSRHLAARATATFRLALPRPAVRAFRRALRKHTRLTARVTVTARDAAGNRARTKRRVKLKR
jgi:plastocyanin